MNASGGEIPAAPLESAATKAVSTPDIAFAAYVDQVRSQGDAFDVISDLSTRAGIVRATIGAFAICSEISVSTLPDLLVAAPVTALLVCGGGLIQDIHRRRIGNRRFKAATSAMVATGQNIELFKVTSGPKRNRGNIVAMWHGPNEHALDPDILDNLKATIALASEHDVAELQVSERVLGPVAPTSLRVRTSAKQSLEDTKNIQSEGAASVDTLYCETTAEWGRALARQEWKEVDIAIEKDRITSLLETLRTVRLDHTLLKLDDELRDTSPAQKRAVLLRAARRALSERTGSTERSSAVRRDSLVMDRSTETRPGKIHVSGTVVGGGRVHLTAPGQDLGMSEIRSRLGLTKTRIAQLLENPDRNREDAAMAIELLLAEELERANQTETVNMRSRQLNDEPVTTTNPDFSPRVTYQEQALRSRKADRRQGKTTWKSQKAARALMALAYGFLAPTYTALVVGAVIEHYEHDVIAARQVTVDQDLGVSSSANNSAEQYGQSQLDAQSPLWRTWDTYRAGGVRLGKYLGFDLRGPTVSPLPPSPVFPSAAITSSGVGNAGDGLPNSPAWDLMTYDMSAKGYWGTMGSNVLEQSTSSGKATFEWLGNEDYALNETVDLPTATNPDIARHIEVSREISPQDVIFLKPYGIELVETPILDGTIIDAARYYPRNGHGIVSLQMAFQDNGLEALIIPKNDSLNGYLYYDVAPTWGATFHATEPLGFAGNIPYNQSSSQGEMARLDPRLGRPMPITQRALRVAGDIRTLLRYAVNPDISTAGIQSDKAFERQVLLKGEDNCNIASTVEELNDPNLNLVVGYLNDGSRAQQRALYTHSLHQYTVDTAGTIIDATSSRMIPGQSGYFSTANPLSIKPKPVEVPKDVELGGLLFGAAGLVLMQRRRIVAARVGYHAFRSGRLETRLVGQTPIALSRANELAQIAAYRAPITVQAAANGLARANLSTTAPSELAKRLITREDLHGPTIRRDIQAVTPGILRNRVMRQQLRQGRRILEQAASIVYHRNKIGTKGH